MAASDLLTAIQGIESALAADSASPQPSYSINGKSVQRNEWRESLLRAAAELKRQYNAYVPYIIRTRQGI